MNWKLDNGIVQLTNLSHVGIAGQGRREDREVECPRSGTSVRLRFLTTRPKKEDLFAGEPFSVRIVNVKFGAYPVELLQPLDDKSIWAKFIEEKGRRHSPRRHGRVQLRSDGGHDAGPGPPTAGCRRFRGRRKVVLLRHLRRAAWFSSSAKSTRRKTKGSVTVKGSVRGAEKRCPHFLCWLCRRL